LLISGRPGVDYAVPDARMVFDPVADAGPLAGLVAVLTAARHSRVLVLAVDLPRVTAAFLRHLVAYGAGRTGVVPQGERGWEPLAALYPKTLLREATAALHRGDHSLQTLALRAEQTGLIARMPLAAEEMRLLTNWNRPEDL